MKYDTYLYAMDLLSAANSWSRGGASWHWALSGTAEQPVVEVQLRLELRDTETEHYLFSASGGTFEAAVIKLAYAFCRHEAARKIGLALLKDQFLRLRIFSSLENCDVRLLDITPEGYKVDGLWPDGSGVTVLARTFEAAEAALVADASVNKLLPSMPGLRDPVQFWNDWHDLEAFPLFRKHDAGSAWQNGECFGAAVMVNPASNQVDVFEPATNTEPRTILRCKYEVQKAEGWATVHDAAYDASGSDFEEAVHLFAEGLRKRGNEHKEVT